jgi:hypothetical protein
VRARSLPRAGVGLRIGRQAKARFQRKCRRFRAARSESWQRISPVRLRILPGHVGAVARSNSPSQWMACSRPDPHMSDEGCRPAQKAGRSGRPKMAQPLSSNNCTQRTPAGLPLGMPGIGEVIEGAVQQAPQPGRQLTAWSGGFMGPVYSPSARLLPQNQGQTTFAAWQKWSDPGFGAIVV